MKVVLYVAELDVKGGTHKQVLRQAQYMKARGHQVQVFTPVYVPSATFPEFEELEVVTPRVAATGRLASVLAAGSLAFDTPSVDVIHVHDNRCLLYFFFLRLLRRSKKIVWQINDLHPSFRIGNSSDAPKKWRHGVGQWLNRRMAASVDAITVNVGKNVDRVRQYLGAKAILFHCGVDLPEGEVSENQSNVDRLKILSTGVFFPFRNYERLILACGQISRSTGIKLHVTIVGDTRYSPGYVQSVKNAARNEGVSLRILENLTDSQLAEEIKSACAFVFVNIDQSWGLSVFEAAARAKPVVLSRSAGASELLSGKPGFEMVDPESVESIQSALSKLVMDPKYADEQGSYARLAVQDMTWDRMYSAPVEALFLRLLGWQ